jgi:hypothetical protein
MCKFSGPGDSGSQGWQRPQIGRRASQKSGTATCKVVRNCGFSRCLWFLLRHSRQYQTAENPSGTFQDRIARPSPARQGPSLRVRTSVLTQASSVKRLLAVAPARASKLLEVSITGGQLRCQENTVVQRCFG